MKKIIFTIFIATLLIGLASANTLALPHVSNDKIRTEIFKEWNKIMQRKDQNKIIQLKKNIIKHQKIDIILIINIFIAYLAIISMLNTNSSSIFSPTILIFSGFIAYFAYIRKIDVISVINNISITISLEDAYIIFLNYIEQVRYIAEEIAYLTLEGSINPLENTNKLKEKEMKRIQTMEGNKENRHNLKTSHLLLNNIIESLICRIINFSQIITKEYTIVLYADMRHAV